MPRRSGESYDDLLASIVFRPLGLAETSLRTRLAMPRPFIHGYEVEAGKEPEDLSVLFSPTVGWASGANVSTPLGVGHFFRSYLRGRSFGAAQKRTQRRFFQGGESAP